MSIYRKNIFRRLEWKNLELTISQRKTILVKDVSTDAKESLGKMLKKSYVYRTCDEQSLT